MGKKKMQGSMTLDFGADDPVSEAVPVPSEAVPVPSETAAAEAFKAPTAFEQVREAVGSVASACAVPALIEVRENGAAVWYLVDIDGPSVEKAWAAYRAVRPVPVRNEFLDILREIAGDAGAKFRTVSKVTL